MWTNGASFARATHTKPGGSMAYACSDSNGIHGLSAAMRISPRCLTIATLMMGLRQVRETSRYFRTGSGKAFNCAATATLEGAARPRSSSSAFSTS